MRQNKLIGLSGTNGAGKDAVGLFLAARHNYLFISVTELLRDELKRRGVPVERENLRALSAEWRREFGYGVLVDRAFEQLKNSGKSYDGLVLASLRNPFEADRVHELDGMMLWIDADPRVRYERIQRAIRPDRAAEDNKTFEQFLAEEQAEMHTSGDAATLDMSAVKARCDHIIMNSGSDITVFERETENALGLPPAA